MRKWQREVWDFNEIVEILGKCDTIRLGLKGMREYPYIVPLSFGYEVVNGRLYIYFHCAQSGCKIDLINNNCNVCVEADCLNGYVEHDGAVTADYESVIGFGKAWRVIGEDAVHGIDLLLKHCGIEGHNPRDCVKMGAVAVYRVTIESITGKKRFK